MYMMGVSYLRSNNRGKIRLSMKSVDQETGEDISEEVESKKQRRPKKDSA